MPKFQTETIIKIFGIFVLVIALAFLLEQQYSPLQKANAWYRLKIGNYTSIEESSSYVTFLYGEPPYNISQKSGLIAEEKTTETVETAQPFTTKQAQDENFLLDKQYTFPAGQDGIYDLAYKTLIINGREVSKYAVKGQVLIQEIPQVVYTGKRAEQEVQKEIEAQWKSLATALTKKDTKSAESIVTAEELNNFEKATKLGDLSYRIAPTAKVQFEIGEEDANTIQVGTIQLKQSNCSVSGSIPVLYLKDQQIYRLSNVYSTLASLCSKPKPTSGVLNCSNCWLAPVSKQFALKSTYAPYVVATGLSGGGSVTPDTKKALSKLFSAAKAEGISKIRISSSYRSYTTQVSLFNSYVQNEKKSGLSEAKAIEKANTYSAKPGHSEHQLGTTVDIMACSYPCSFYDVANKPLSEYLKKNAHKFGFVISYPDGSQPYTGYVYEPWHIRYVGVTYATELYNRGYLTKKGFYLYQFLLEKGKY